MNNRSGELWPKQTVRIHSGQFIPANEGQAQCFYSTGTQHQQNNYAIEGAVGAQASRGARRCLGVRGRQWPRASEFRVFLHEDTSPTNCEDPKGSMTVGRYTVRDNHIVGQTDQEARLVWQGPLPPAGPNVVTNNFFGAR